MKTEVNIIFAIIFLIKVKKNRDMLFIPEALLTKSLVGKVFFRKSWFFFKISSLSTIKNEYINNYNLKEKFSIPKIVFKSFDSALNLGIIIQEDMLQSKKRFLLSNIINSSLSDKMIMQITKNIYSQHEKEKIKIETKRGSNDCFFIDRLKKNGRLETFLEDGILIHNQILSEKHIKNSKIIIEGIEYEETIQNLIDDARKICSEQTKRPMWLSHGDMIESNICLNKKLEISFIDLETFGENWVVSDIVIPLIALAYMFDYTLPVYMPESLYKMEKTKELGLKSSLLKSKKNPSINISNNNIHIKNAMGFLCQKSRKRIIHHYYNNVLIPVINKLKYIESDFSYSIDEQFKACFFMRLMGTHDFRSWSSNDKLRLISNLYKIVGTPINGNKNHPYHNFIKLV